MKFITKKITFETLLDNWRKNGCYYHFPIYIVNTNSKKYVKVCETSDVTFRVYTNRNVFMETYRGIGFYNAGTYRTHVDIENDMLKQTYIKLKTCVIFTTHEEASLYAIKLRKIKGIQVPHWMRQALTAWHCKM